MKFNQLHVHGPYGYLPTMEELSVFNLETGDRVACWYLEETMDGRVYRCLVNTLPVDLIPEFNVVACDWRVKVEYHKDGPAGDWATC